MQRSALLLTVVASTAAAQEGVPPNATADSVLDRLLGTWMMIGQVGGDSVRYTLRVERTLQDRYVSLHMLDDARPPGYEARVVIGADTLAPRIIAHWMDSFGAAYSVPAGYGRAEGDSIQFTIAYPTGIFRDVFSANPDGSWRLAIDAQTADGWRSFADYRIVPRQETNYDEGPTVANLNVLRGTLQQSAQRLISVFDELIGSDRSVRVRVELNAAGDVTAMAIVQGSGHRAVDSEALSVLAKTRFTPGRRSGVAVPSTVVVPVRFIFPDS